MKRFMIAAMSLCSAASWANEMQVDGTWLQKQQISTVTRQESGWQLRSDQQQLALSHVPAWLKAPIIGDWLELKTRFNPAGITQRFMWSKSEFEPAYLLAGHSSRLNDAAFGEWRWEANSNPARLVLVKQGQRTTVKLKHLKNVAGWCVYLSDVRPAKPSVTGIANESETRFDWWAQRTDGPCAPA
ncbi:hypothetical protein NT239_09705 [Chitinibacter sp. SCUT-21]|uniref:hypothetical protein n=1 Tax=Chitinibacter sp. SCUT-21 TaxID=2970891 RepID=UPI0035A6B44E